MLRKDMRRRWRRSAKPKIGVKSFLGELKELKKLKELKTNVSRRVLFWGELRVLQTRKLEEASQSAERRVGTLTFLRPSEQASELERTLTLTFLRPLEHSKMSSGMLEEIFNDKKSNNNENFKKCSLVYTGISFRCNIFHARDIMVLWNCVVSLTS